MAPKTQAVSVSKGSSFSRDLRSLNARSDSTLTGLSGPQEEICKAALQAFMSRHGLERWRLSMDLNQAGPDSSLLDISVMASREFDFQIRSSRMTVDRTVDLGEVVDLCLETHYNACMNAQARSNQHAAVSQFDRAAR